MMTGSRARAALTAGLAAAGLAAGAIATGLGDRGAGGEADTRAVFERYEQRPPCRDAQVAHHALVALRVRVPEADLAAVRRVVIRDPGVAHPVEAEIGQGSYAFARLFGKARHHEQYRPWCALGVCRFGLNYYVNEYPAPASAPAAPKERVVEVAAFDGQGQALGAPQATAIVAPTRQDAAERAYAALDAGLTGGRFWAEVDTGAVDDGPPLTVMFQTRDAAGAYAETPFKVPRGRGRVRLEVAGERADLAYAGVFAYRLEGNASTENKVELADRANPAYACAAAR